MIRRLVTLTFLVVPLFGIAANKYQYSIRVANGQARVNGDDPDIWIVDDVKALGGILSCSDIRWYYRNHPSAPAVGYVLGVEDLPCRKIKRLVLAGKAGEDWLNQLKKEDQKTRCKLPEEIVVLSPTIQFLSQLDPSLITCKVRLVVGEFSAQYYEGFANPPQWVTVVPGMELYIKNWMRFAVE